jgi:hypothetical protein
MGLLARYTKPLLTFFLRIDFGKVTYESDFYDLLKVRASHPRPSLLLPFAFSACARCTLLLSCPLQAEGYEVVTAEPMARSVIKGGAQCIVTKIAAPVVAGGV